MTPYANGYLYRKLITIDHTKVSGGADLTNYPFSYGSTDPDLKNTAYGGKVYNTNGYDVIFTDLSGNLLNFMITGYVNTNGTYRAFIQIPTVSYAVDTQIYVYFGKSTVNTSQENISGVQALDFSIANLNKLVSTTLRADTLVQGGVLRTINGATGGIAITGAGWLESNESLGYYLRVNASAVSAMYDATVLRTGTKTLKLSNTNVSGAGYISMNPGGNGNLSVSEMTKYLIPVKSSTAYVFNIYTKTNNSVGSFVSLYGYDAAGTATLLGVSNTVTGTTSGATEWQVLTKSITTGASTVYILPTYRNSTAGNISDNWFDINGQTLDELATANASAISDIRPEFTGVTSTTSIDQSNTQTPTGGKELGKTTQQKIAIKYTPTKNNTCAVDFFFAGNVGTPVQNVTLGLQADSSGSPSGTNLGAINYTAVQFSALTVSTTVPTNAVLGSVIDTPASQYWIVFSCDTADNSNYYLLYANYTVSQGTNAKQWNGSAWSDITDLKYQFKEYYPKRTETGSLNANSTTLEPTAPNSDGILNGAIIDTDKGVYSWSKDVSTDAGALSFANDVYSATAGGLTTGSLIINSWQTSIGIKSSNDATNKFITLKVNTTYLVKNLRIGQNAYQSDTRKENIWFSPDNSTWTLVLTGANTSAGYAWEYQDTPLANGLSTFYLRWGRTSATTSFYNTQGFSIQAILDTSSITYPQSVIGTNNIYLSSNGSSVDATQDPSLQCSTKLILGVPYRVSQVQSISPTINTGSAITIPDPKYAIELYQIDLANNKFVRIDMLSTFKNLQYFSVLNDKGGASFDLNLYDPKATQTNLTRWKNQVVIKRYGVPVWFGPIVKVSGDYTNTNGYLTVECNDYLSHLSFRNTAKNVNYTQIEQCLIAWNLINDSQSLTNGSLFITKGTSPTSILRDRTYQYGTISNLLSNLTQVIGGFDFMFTPTLDANGLLTGVVFNCYYPGVGNIRTDLPPLEIGTNVKDFQFRTDGDLTNSDTFEGGGTGSTIISTSSLAGSQLAYTRRENYQSIKDVVVQSTLDEKLTQYLTANAVENYLMNIQLYADTHPGYGEFSLGDTLNLNLNIANSGGYVNFQKQARVIELAVQVDELMNETLIPKLSIVN